MSAGRTVFLPVISSSAAVSAMTFSTNEVRIVVASLYTVAASLRQPPLLAILRMLPFVMPLVLAFDLPLELFATDPCFVLPVFFDADDLAAGIVGVFGFLFVLVEQ
eukprot:TRINITY_DN10516_c0_g1_i1.p3 TRINITY_DN10516_c0_g1~~TRINITY_DN10516_c0_g1_i1.p3  ORF type:complete len:106 (+),score=13.90 TRINITY_DN10516_c0_g1_i1:149-466(+)